MARTKSARRKVRLTPDCEFAKKQLAKIFTATMYDRDAMTQMQAAQLTQDAPSQLSLIATNKLDGISLERLISLLRRQGQDVMIAVRRTNTPRGNAETGFSVKVGTLEVEGIDA